MKRSKHSLSHYKLLTCKLGQLVPLTWFEALPGDSIQHATSCLIRCAPLVTPPMHPVHVRIHHFFVPNRIIWTNWPQFITGGANGMDTTAHPYINNGVVPVSSLGDYLGWPTSGLGANLFGNALPFRAYCLIWNEFYRDQDLQTAIAISLADGADSTNYQLQNVCWEKDYLTSSRPWVIKGSSVTLPLGTTAPIRGLGISSGVTAATSQTYYDTDSTSTHTDPGWQSGSQSFIMRAQSTNVPSATNIPQVFADLTGATAVDINTVRHAFAIQRFEEARARFGSRYTEYLRYLGVRSSDARLQRPEYLGGGKQTIQFSEVLQTGVTTSGTQGGVGTMFGHGIAAMRSNRYRRFFEEHGIVMSLMSVLPRSMYSQRVKRAFLRGTTGANGISGTKEDYWQRELEHIGQQGVNGWEADASVGGTVTFGYQDRYDEYRREESSVAGLFRSTLDTWHFSREFGSAPSLNSTFVSAVPAQRMFADTANDCLYVMANHNIQARRLVSREGNSLTF